MKVPIFGKPIRVEIIYVMCIILGGIIAMNTFCGCKKEGYEQRISGYLKGSGLQDTIGDGVKSSWVNPLKTGGTKGYNNRLDTNVGSQGGPLAASELLIFDSTKFAPECCPSAYSNSSGCVCASPEQMKFLNTRGGNRSLGGDF
jgi:hypothetical protein